MVLSLRHINLTALHLASRISFGNTMKPMPSPFSISQSSAGPGNAIWLASAEIEPQDCIIPILESPQAQAGFPSPAADYVEELLDLNKLLVTNPPATFFFRCRGCSLVDAGIFDGDVLVVDRSVPATGGRIVVASLDGSLYVKRLKNLRGRMALVSENKAEAASYPTLYFDQSQDNTVWGVVTSIVRRL